MSGRLDLPAPGGSPLPGAAAGNRSVIIGRQTAAESGGRSRSPRPADRWPLAGRDAARRLACCSDTAGPRLSAEGRLSWRLAFPVPNRPRPAGADRWRAAASRARRPTRCPRSVGQRRLPASRPVTLAINRGSRTGGRPPRARTVDSRRARAGEQAKCVLAVRLTVTVAAWGMMLLAGRPCAAGEGAPAVVSRHRSSPHHGQGLQLMQSSAAVASFGA